MTSQLSRLENSWLKILIVFYNKYLNVEILLAEGKVDSAIAAGKLLSPTNKWWATFFEPKPYRKDVLARAYIKKGEMDKAVKEYEWLTTPYPENNYKGLRHPTYHYRLAKLYEQTNQNEKAVERYERFLALWKNADKDLPEMIDANKRLALLKK